MTEARPERIGPCQIQGELGRGRSAHISGAFKAGATRRLDVSVSRLTREPALEWP